MVTTSRSFGLAVSSLSDQELRIAIARDVLGWKMLRIDRNGRITGDHPTVLTTVPLTVPDWLGNDTKLAYLESLVMGKVGTVAYRESLGKVAGDFNSNPTARQRCEAVLSAVRQSRDGLIV
jgi:hypothetical protein